MPNNVRMQERSRGKAELLMPLLCGRHRFQNANHDQGLRGPPRAPWNPLRPFTRVLLTSLPFIVALAYDSRKALPTFFDMQEPNGKGLLPEDAGGGGGARVQ